MEGYMWYFVVVGLAAIYVIVDGFRRNAPLPGIVLGLLTFLFLPLGLPLWLALRPLRGTETREGGKAWNILKSFALMWTAFMLLISILSVSGMGSLSPTQSDAEAVGQVLGVSLGFGLLGCIWFVPMVGAVVLGFFLKKSSVIEYGPDVSVPDTMTPKVT
jgi:hypothetical protein